MKNIKLVKNYKLILLSAIILIVTSQLSFAQSNVYNYDYSIGLGFTTSKILGDNPAVNTISPINTKSPGGSFNGAMPGALLMGQYKLDEVGDWRLVGGLNYTAYAARERLPREKVTYRLKNNLDIISPLVGINYTLIRFPSAMSSIYIGAEARYNYIFGQSFVVEADFVDTGEITTQVRDTKDAVSRMGGLVKIGLEGELHENYMINVSWGVDALNLLGADDSRGQLLTPYIPDENTTTLGFEQEEQLTYNFFFSIMIQYRY